MRASLPLHRGGEGRGEGENVSVAAGECAWYLDTVILTDRRTDTPKMIGWPSPFITESRDGRPWSGPSTPLGVNGSAISQNHGVEVPGGNRAQIRPRPSRSELVALAAL